LSILISIFTLSALTLYLNQVTKEVYIIYFVTAVSIVSLIISIYLLSVKESEHSRHYLERAELYSVLYKKAKNFEAIYQSEPGIHSDKLREKLSYFENEQEKLLKISLEIKKEDYDLAKVQIRTGKNYGYDEIDEENT